MNAQNFENSIAFQPLSAERCVHPSEGETMQSCQLVTAIGCAVTFSWALGVFSVPSNPLLLRASHERGNSTRAGRLVCKRREGTSVTMSVTHSATTYIITHWTRSTLQSACAWVAVFVFPTIFHKGRKIKPATLSWAGIVFRLRSGELLVSSVFSKTCTNKQAFIARTDFSWWWHYINWSLYVRAFFIVTNLLVLQLSLQPRTQRAGKCTTKGNAVCIDPGLYILHHS